MADEITAMSQIEQALAPLEPDEVRRVLGWAVDKFGSPQLGGGLGSGAHPRPPLDTRRRGSGNLPAADRLADLIDLAAPETVSEYALVASYWFQVLNGAENVSGMEINSELKDLGHGTDNITAAFSGLIERTPRLARQVQKSGSSRQARKKYRLTEEGVRRVEAMIAGSGDS
jgi:hypothetical protein